jgi:glucose dehydrogenase
MRRSRLLIAAVVALVGLAWIGQGLNVIKGSAMTGSSFWAAVGVALLIVAGAILLRERRPATPR